MVRGEFSAATSQPEGLCAFSGCKRLSPSGHASGAWGLFMVAALEPENGSLEDIAAATRSSQEGAGCSRGGAGLASAEVESGPATSTCKASFKSMFERFRPKCSRHYHAELFRRIHTLLITNAFSFEFCGARRIQRSRAREETHMPLKHPMRTHALRMHSHDDGYERFRIGTAPSTEGPAEYGARN